MHEETRGPVHLRSLDALRGIAALAIVVFHYSNFFMVLDQLPPSFVQSEQPFFAMIPLIYQNGWLAVDLFFTLSGFVFFWLYAAKIAAGTISARTFFVLRFSRLYPLHFVTLLLVLWGQWAYSVVHPDTPYFCGGFNGLGDFLLQLGFATNWLPDSHYSFNFPVWSISIEVLLYAMFFVLCRVAGVRILLLALISITGFWLIYRFHAQLARGVGSFFLGGLLSVVFTKSLKSPASTRKTHAVLAVAVAVACWVAGMAGMISAWEFLPPFLASRMTRYFPVVFLFPATVLAFALVESRWTIRSVFSWLGDISYSMYLIHFPLQIAFALGADLMGFSRSAFYSPWAFVLFFSTLIPLSTLSFNAFERPAQRALRQWAGPVRVRPTMA